MKLEHLDITDSRRGDLFADAEHHDCEYYLSGMCGNDEYVVAQLLADAMGGNPDASYAGLTITVRPEWGAAANRCPGFWPTTEYLTELVNHEHDAALTYREDFNRRSAVMMGAQS